MALLTRATVFAVLLAIAASSTARAQVMEVPVSVQLPLFIKVVSFDRQLHSRAGATLVLCIAYQGGYRESVDAKEEAARAASLLREVDGLPVSVVVVDLDREALDVALTHSKATVLYVAPLHGIDVKDIVSITRSAHVTTLTGVLRYVEQGMSVGVRLLEDRPHIVVNLAASRLEGAEFAAKLLKLAQVL